MWDKGPENLENASKMDKTQIWMKMNQTELLNNKSIKNVPRKKLCVLIEESGNFQ